MWLNFRKAPKLIKIVSTRMTRIKIISFISLRVLLPFIPMQNDRFTLEILWPWLFRLKTYKINVMTHVLGFYCFPKVWNSSFSNGVLSSSAKAPAPLSEASGKKPIIAGKNKIRISSLLPPTSEKSIYASLPWISDVGALKNPNFKTQSFRYFFSKAAVTIISIR